MNLFKQKTTWSGSELWLFKLSVFTIGIVVGTYLQNFLAPFLNWLAVLSIFGCIWSGFNYAAKTKSAKH